MDTDVIVDTISETLLIGSQDTQQENESSYVQIYIYFTIQSFTTMAAAYICISHFCLEMALLANIGVFL